MKRIIVVANQKGGVGKTTICVNLGAALSLIGKKILLIDMDPQAAATVSFIEKSQNNQSIADVLGDARLDIKEIISKTSLPNLDIAPSSISLAKLESSLLGSVDGQFRLKDAIANIKKEDYDYIIIDTPPTLGLLTINSMTAATELMIPIQASYYAMEGTNDLLETFQRIKKRLNQDLRLLGIIINLYNKTTNISRDVRTEIINTFKEKVFKTVINKCVRLEESPAYKKDIITYDRSSEAAKEFQQLAREVINHDPKNRTSAREEISALS